MYLFIYICIYIYIKSTLYSFLLSHVQVGVLGDEEEWVTLHEVENEPDAQMLEVPNLIPYTHYR